ncbi:unnamed protein product [Nyctereutes procyonoides]|uniref:(raccoon dog) hypothetical protein n=1 Tax=Nyctereutes procyonoides TaxID=34880 RepID=A0A811Y2M6_NYCPR|nr:unnamed protein product [Nyctereutes procyonoides]
MTDSRGMGLLRTDPVPEEGEDVVATIGATETLSEEEQEELRRELAKVEEEIQTLSQVLAAKEKHLAEIKRKLGINSLQELKQNIAKGWQDVTATSAYKKTSETLSQAGQKASAAFSSVGSVITKKLEDVKLQAFSHSFSIRSIQHSISMPAMRNSPTFKSFEEKVENLKAKVINGRENSLDYPFSTTQSTDIENKNTFNLESLFLDLFITKCTLYFFFCIVFEHNKNSVIWVWVLLYVLSVKERGESINRTSLQTLHVLGMGKKPNPLVAIWD